MDFLVELNIITIRSGTRSASPSENSICSVLSVPLDRLAKSPGASTCPQLAPLTTKTRNVFPNIIVIWEEFESWTNVGRTALAGKASMMCEIFYHVNSGTVTAHRDGGEQPLAKIATHNAVYALHDAASIRAYLLVLGTKVNRFCKETNLMMYILVHVLGEDAQWINVELSFPNPSEDDWVGVFSPAKFNSSTCPPEGNPRQQAPYICSAPIKYKYANDSSSDYTKTGNASLQFQLINQRADFSFALFSGGFSNPKLVAISNAITFANPKAPLYPRLALGKSWNEMTVTWTSGYNIDEAVPFVEWGLGGEHQKQSPAGTLTFH
ncbi:unnamed protein product [Ilex paraguariensis]|uniref:Purple acid phosphatase Fn3-like domain-containing protein n=1 Tax=Ilex paraguariensis TaxID=185542 RepID=A0ABC8RVW5_9AQUA